jgi:glycosyltransferase involved in cell wall biosynthesis
MSMQKNIRVCQVLHGIVGGGSEQVVPLVSIVIPVYNAARTIEKCVESLILQTFNDIEILLVNNGSTDNSLDVCQKLVEKDSRIKIINIAEKGVSVARNKGLEAASGKYISFVDADDWIDSNVCELFANLNAEHDYELFCYSAQYHKKKKTTISYLFNKDIELLSQNQKEELQIKVFAPQAPIFSYKMNTRFAGSACGKFYKREILLKNNLRFSTETIISEDVLFNTLSLDYFHRIGYTKQCFYHYEQSEDSAQNRYRPNSDKYFIFIIEKIQEWLRNTAKDQRFVDAANCLFVHYLFGILKEDLFHRDNKLRNEERKKILNQIFANKSLSKTLQNANTKFFSFPEKTLMFLLKRKNYISVKVIIGTYNKILKQ